MGSSVLLPSIQEVWSKDQVIAHDCLRPVLNYLYERAPYLRPHFVNTQIKVIDQNGPWYITTQDREFAMEAVAKYLQVEKATSGAGTSRVVTTGAPGFSPVDIGFYRELGGSPTKVKEPPSYSDQVDIPALLVGGQTPFSTFDLLTSWPKKSEGYHPMEPSGPVGNCRAAAFRYDTDMGEIEGVDSEAELLTQLLAWCGVNQRDNDSNTTAQHTKLQIEPVTPSVTPENSPMEEIVAPSQGTQSDSLNVKSDQPLSILQLKPIVICIEGLIGAGKSTAVQLARPALEGMGFAVHEEPIMTYHLEIVSLFYNDPRRYAFQIQMASLQSYGQVKTSPLIVIERSPDASFEVFAINLKINGLLTQEQLRELNAARKNMPWEPTAHIHVDTPPNICLQRISHRQRDGEGAITSDMLWDHAYLYGNMYGSLNRDVHFIDGEDTEMGVAEEIVRIASQYINPDSHRAHAEIDQHMPAIMTRGDVSVKRNLVARFGIVADDAAPPAKKVAIEGITLSSVDQEMSDVGGAAAGSNAPVSCDKPKTGGSMSMITRFFRPRLPTIPEPIVLNDNSSTSDLTEP